MNLLSEYKCMASMQAITYVHLFVSLVLKLAKQIQRVSSTALQLRTTKCIIIHSIKCSQIIYVVEKKNC